MTDGFTPYLGQHLPPTGRRRPDVVLSAVAWAWVVGCAVLLTTFSFGRDQSIYATVGQGMLQGQVPYRDLWDFKTPGIFAVFALGEALFGHSMASTRILEASGLLLMAATLSSLSKRWFDTGLPGIIGAAIAATVHIELDFWHSGQPESYGGMLTLFALWLVTKPDPRNWVKILYWGAAGVLIGCAALLKPPLGGVVLVVAAYLARDHLVAHRRATWLGLGVLVVGAGIPTLCCLAWFWAKGGMNALLWTLRDYVPGYTALGWQGERHALEMFYYAAVEVLTRFSALIAIGIAAWLLLPRHSDRELQEVLLLFGCAIVHVTGIALQAKFFQYHYGATIPLLSLAAGLGWYKLWIRAWAKHDAFAFSLGLLVVLGLLVRKPVNDVPGTVLERSWARLQFLLHRPAFDTRQKLDAALHRAADYDLASNYKVSRWVSEHVPANATILVWGFEPSIYWFTGRRPATRFIYNVPQRSNWQTDVSQQLFIDEVRARAPRVIIVQHNDVFPGVTGDVTDSAADLAKFDALRRYVESEFEFVATLDDFDILSRRN